MQASLLSRSSNETTLINYSEEIVMQRYLSGEWFNFETYLVHQIQTKVDGDLVISIYISKDYLPLFSTLEIKVFSGDRVIEKDNKTKLAFNEGVNLRISCRMQKDEVIWTRIKLKKKMNSFENYPHDPERGHDIVR